MPPSSVALVAVGSILFRYPHLAATGAASRSVVDYEEMDDGRDFC